MKQNRLGKFSTVILILCLLLLIAGTVSLFLVTEDAIQSRIAFQMFETAVMMAIIFLPTILDRLAHIKVPHSMEVCFVAFGFCSLIMGDVVDLYSLLPWWDALLHAFSGNPKNQSESTRKNRNGRTRTSCEKGGNGFNRIESKAPPITGLP